jgi:hypothetical protein
MIKRTLLIFGILSSLFYTFMNVFIPGQWEEYSSFSQTVSELSAIDAPTRAIWVLLGWIYTFLFVGFGLGVVLSAGSNRSNMIAGWLLIINGVLGLVWPPMHQREALAAGQKSLTDTLHIAFTIITVLLMLLAMAFGSVSNGKGFRIYSILSIVLLLLFGSLTGRDAPLVESNQPTPWIGVWERINIGIFYLWVILFALVILQKEYIFLPRNRVKV